MDTIPQKVIITGSQGLLGIVMTKRLQALDYEVLKLDLSLGHDLTDCEFVKKWFSVNKAQHLINLFAINDAVTVERNSESFMDASLGAFSKTLDVNVVSLLSVCREFIRNQDKGTITNFTSIYGVVSPRPHMYSSGEKFIGYGVSKAAVIQLSRHLAVHAAPNFRVNCVMPGGVEANQPLDFTEGYSLQAPIGRMMKPEEITGIVEFLISDKSSYCTGGLFPVDGGWTAW